MGRKVLHFPGAVGAGIRHAFGKERQESAGSVMENGSGTGRLKEREDLDALKEAWSFESPCRMTSRKEVGLGGLRPAVPCGPESIRGKWCPDQSSGWCSLCHSGAPS
jgi:hypothetical protein